MLSITTPSDPFVKIDESTKLRLFNALKNGNKQTRIYIAKSIYKFKSIFYSLDKKDFFILEQYLFDEVFDVSINISLFFLEGLKKLSKKTNKKIEKSIVNSVINLYSFEKLYYNGKEYSEQINESILNLYKRETRKGFEINSAAEKLFSYLIQTGTYISPCLKIYNHCAKNKHDFSSATILLLEDYLNIDDHFEQILSIFKNVVKCKKNVSNHVLDIFLHQLYTSSNSVTRREAYDFLQIGLNSSIISSSDKKLHHSIRN